MLLTFAVILSVPLQGAIASSKSPYDSGYDHGCDDAGYFQIRLIDTSTNLRRDLPLSYL